MDRTTRIKLFTVLGILAVLVIIEVIQMLFAQYPITNWPPKGTTVVAYGDSLTEGVGASSVEHGYVSVLSARLNTPIANQGVSGDTAEQALARIAHVEALDPQIVVLLLGGNDILRQVPRPTTLTHMRSIIQRLQQGGAVVILVGFKGLLGDGVNDDYERLAKETGCLFVPDVLDGILRNPSLMSDEVHPNDAGYLKIADRIAPTLEAAIVTAQETAAQRVSTTRTDPAIE